MAGFPAKLIVSTTGSLTYLFDKALSLISKRYIPVSQYSLKNSFELRSNLKILTVPGNYRLVSFDVSNMYTNLPFELILEGISNKWNYISEYLPC